MADAAGFDVKELERIHMAGEQGNEPQKATHVSTLHTYIFMSLVNCFHAGELTRGDCSLVGAWGAATEGGRTLAVRALDWDTDGPFVSRQQPMAVGAGFAAV